MAPLKNTRREKFCLALAEGRSATESYELAGFKPCRKNAARLTTFDDIQARVAEIQSAAARKSEVTLGSIMAELEEARERATTKDQMAAAVRAIMGKAQLAGLLVEKVEVASPGVFDHCHTKQELWEALFERLATARGVEFSEEDRQKFAGLLMEAQAIIDRCTMKPAGVVIDGTASLKDIRALEHEQRKPRPPVRRLLNGG